MQPSPRLLGTVAHQRYWRAIAIFLAIVQALPLSARQAAPLPPLSPAAQAIKDKVTQIPIGGKLTVRMLNRTEYHGRLLTVDPQTFSLSEVDLKQTVTVPYTEADRLRKNYGGKGVGGRRVDPKKNLIVFSILLGTLFTVIFVALAHDN